MSDSDYDQFVEGGSVRWRDVGLTIVGSGITLVGIAIVRSIEIIEHGLLTGLSGMSDFLASVIATPFDGSIEAIQTSWETFGSFLPSLGVAAFPVAVGMSALVILILIRGVSRYA